MTRLHVVALLFAVSLTAPPAADAQQAAKVYRIGVLHSAYAQNAPWVEGLRIGLQELGFTEGREVTFEHRYTAGSLERLPEAAAALVNADVDVLFTSNDEVTRVAMTATRTIPIVFATARDPVGAGIVAELARPGGNVTGVSNLVVELTPKRLELLKQLVPGLRRVWMIYYARDSSAGPVLRAAREAAALLKLELRTQPVQTVEEFVRAQNAIRRDDGLLLHEGPTPLDISAQLLDRSMSGRIPAIFTSEFWITHGALVSYGADFHAIGRQSARLVARILRGARPRDLPVEAANKVRLVINLKTAKAFGLVVPPSLLLRADEVVR